MSQDLFEQMIQKNHPNLFNTMQTEEYKLSNQILQFRVGHGIEIEEIANYLKMKVDDYHDFEYGTAEKDILEYQNIFEQLKKYYRLHSQKYLLGRESVIEHPNTQILINWKNELAKQVREGDSSWQATENMYSITL